MFKPQCSLINYPRTISEAASETRRKPRDERIRHDAQDKLLNYAVTAAAHNGKAHHGHLVWGFSSETDSFEQGHDDDDNDDRPSDSRLKARGWW